MIIQFTTATPLFQATLDFQTPSLLVGQVIRIRLLMIYYASFPVSFFVIKFNSFDLVFPALSGREPLNFANRAF